MSRISIAAAAAALALAAASAAVADSHEGRTFAPVDTFTCNYRQNKGPQDLEKVIARWSNWMDEREQGDYFAVTVTPVYHGEESFDVGWLGSWPSGKAMGEGLDRWFAEGGEINQGFLSVLDCETHSNFASTELRAPPSETPPDNIVLTFSDCSINEGASFDDVMAGLEAWSTYQDEKGYRNGAWMMFPVFGGGDADFDFKLLEGFPDYTALGEYYDMYGTGGDWEKHMALVGGLLTCDDARVYSGTVRRRAGTE